jgi:hypothetical protein
VLERADDLRMRICGSPISSVLSRTAVCCSQVNTCLSNLNNYEVLRCREIVFRGHNVLDPARSCQRLVFRDIQATNGGFVKVPLRLRYTLCVFLLRHRNSWRDELSGNVGRGSGSKEIFIKHQADSGAC